MLWMHFYKFVAYLSLYCVSFHIFTFSDKYILYERFLFSVNLLIRTIKVHLPSPFITYGYGHLYFVVTVMCFSRGEYDLCHGRNLENQDKEVSCEAPEEEALSVSPQCLTLHFRYTPHWVYYWKTWSSSLMAERRMPPWCAGLGSELRSRFHERTILLWFLGIILRVLRFEVSVYNVYITNHFCSLGGGGGEMGLKNKKDVQVKK